MNMDEIPRPVKPPYPSPRKLVQRPVNPFKVTFIDLVVEQLTQEFLSTFKMHAIESSLVKV